MFNEIEGDSDDMAITNFKVNLLVEHDLRKSLTRKLVRSVLQLMDRIDEYKWVKEGQQQGKGKAKVVSQDRRDSRSDRYNNNRPWRDFTRHFRSWRKLRMSHTFNGQTRWEETPQSTTRAFIANTTRSRGILLKIARHCGVVWSSWSKWES